MPDYVKLAATVKRLIAASGRAVSVSKRVETPTDATKPWRGGGTSASASSNCKALMLGRKGVDDDTVRQSTQRALVAATDVVGIDLTEYDYLTDLDGTVWEIDSAELVAPGVTKLLWKMTLSK